MERFFPNRSWENIKRITDIPEGPETILIGLERFPNIKVDRLPLSTTTYSDFKRKVKAVGSNIGRKPHVLVLCHAGIYRSRLIAERLLDDDLVTLSIPNINLTNGEVKGYGSYDLDDWGFGFSEEGVSGHPSVNSPIDMLVLNFAMNSYRTGDRTTMTHVASILEKGLQSGIELKHPFFIMWLEGIEDDFEKWLKK